MAWHGMAWTRPRQHVLGDRVTEQPWLPTTLVSTAAVHLHGQHHPTSHLWATGLPCGSPTLPGLRRSQACPSIQNGCCAILCPGAVLPEAMPYDGLWQHRIKTDAYAASQQKVRQDVTCCRAGSECRLKEQNLCATHGIASTSSCQIQSLKAVAVKCHQVIAR